MTVLHTQCKLCPEELCQSKVKYFTGTNTSHLIYFYKSICIMYAGILYVSVLLTVIKLTLQIILGCMLFLHPKALNDRSLAGQI